jgi:Beta-lactamase enzyme family
MAVGWAIGALAGGAFETHGELRACRAWSTMKVPVIVASITSGRADWHAIERAITRSDNDAALGLWRELDDGPAQVEAVLRSAGAGETVLEREPDPRGWSPFGRTVWTLEAGATFYRALARGELLDPADTGRVLDLMSRVVPEQCWGLGRVPGIRFKGGWGPTEEPGGGYEVIQFGIAGDAVLALAAVAADFESAQELASKHVSQHQNAPQLRAAGDRGRDPRVVDPVRPQDQRIHEAVAGQRRGVRPRRGRGR